MIAKKPAKMLMVLFAMLLLLQVSVPFVMALPVPNNQHAVDVFEDDDDARDDDWMYAEEIEGINDSDYDEFIEFVPVDLNLRAANAAFDDRVGIYNEADLMAFFAGTLTHQGVIASNDMHFELRADITLTGTTQGRGLVNGQIFTGIFDGNGYTITNLQLRRSGGAHVGFIQNAGESAVIRNVTFHHEDGFAFDFPLADSTAEMRVGMLAGRVHSGVLSIENVRFTGETVMRAGWNALNASHASTFRMGGMVGHVESDGGVHVSNVSLEHMRINITSNNTKAQHIHSAGGLIGSSNGTVYISNTQDQHNHVGVAIHGATNFDRIHGVRNAGGIIGFVGAGITMIESTTVTGVSSSNAHDARWFIHTVLYGGGFVGNTGNNGQVVVIDAENHVHVAATMNNSRIGGIVGRSAMMLTIDDVKNYGTIRMPRPNETTIFPSYTQLGGIVGRADGQTLIVLTSNHGLVENAPIHGLGKVSSLGGIVGFSNNNITIAHTVNTGVVNRAGEQFGVNNHVGGIIGLVNNGSGSTQRTTELSHVRNEGDINTDAPTGPNSGMVSFHAGGMIGMVRHATSATLNINDVVNTGAVRGRENVGGIIGNADAHNITIDQAINEGFIHNLMANRRAGGIVGFSSRDFLTIRDSANIGVVFNVGAASTVSTGGVGGIVGSAQGRDTRIENSFNQGYIHAGNFRTGGVVGQSRNTTLLHNVYNLGYVRSAAVNGGAGLLGHRHNGNVVIRNAYVAANVSGASVATSNFLAAHGVTGITFENVYVDASTARFTQNAAQLQGSRNGISVITTELLTSGLLPGISSAPWMYGVALNPAFESPHELRTYPYFAWQTNGMLQSQFFESVNRHLDFEFAQSNLTVQWEQVLRDQVRSVFNAYHAQVNVNHQSGTFQPLPENNAVTTGRMSTNRLVSVGLISTNHVVVFGAADVPERFTVFAYDDLLGYDAIINEARFETNMAAQGIVANDLGIFIGHISFLTENTVISVTAPGFHTVQNHPMTPDDIVDGKLFIPMTRTPMDIRVYVRQPRTTAEEDLDLLGLNISSTSTVHHNGQQIGRSGTGLLTHFILQNAMVDDVIEAFEPRFMRHSGYINRAEFRRDANNEYATDAQGRYILDIHLINVNLANFYIVPYLYNEFAESEDDARLFFNQGTLADGRFSRLSLEWQDPVVQNIISTGYPPYPPTMLNPRRWRIQNATELTAFRIIDLDEEFEATEWFYVSSDDFDPSVPRRIYVPLYQVQRAPEPMILTNNFYFLSTRESSPPCNTYVLPNDVFTLVFIVRAYADLEIPALDVTLHIDWPAFMGDATILNTHADMTRVGNQKVISLGDLYDYDSVTIIMQAPAIGPGNQAALNLWTSTSVRLGGSDAIPLISPRVATNISFTRVDSPIGYQGLNHVHEGDIFKFVVRARADDKDIQNAVLIKAWPTFLSEPFNHNAPFFEMIDQYAVFELGNLEHGREAVFEFYARAHQNAFKDELLTLFTVMGLN